MYGVITSYMWNAVLYKVMYLEAPESMIHLHMHLECASFALQMCSHHRPSYYLLVLVHCSLLCKKKCNVVWFAIIKTRFCTLVQKWIAAFYLSQHHSNILTLGPFFLALRHLVHQTCRYVIHRKFIHWHCLHNGNQVFIQCRQALKQGHDNVFVSHGYLQTNKLIRKCLDLVDVV